MSSGAPGREAGYTTDGEPGARQQYGEEYYGAFLLDPDGNSVEAVHGGDQREGVIDHLWIRVADLAAAKRFYETIAPHAGLRLGHDGPDRATFAAAGGTFSLVPGTPTENLHMAFPTDDDGDVHGFHQAATDAGLRVQRRARRATPLSPRLLRRLRARPRRQQHRGRQPPSDVGR